MQAFFKMLVLLLLAALIAAPLAAPGLRTEAASQQRPAGCHEDSGNVPAPGPINHSCCQAGHHPAIPQQRVTSRPLLQVAALVEYSPHAAVVAALGTFPSFMIVYGDPPAPLPLRV